MLDHYVTWLLIRKISKQTKKTFLPHPLSYINIVLGHLHFFFNEKKRNKINAEPCLILKLGTINTLIGESKHTFTVPFYSLCLIIIKIWDA